MQRRTSDLASSAMLKFSHQRQFWCSSVHPDERFSRDDDAENFWCGEFCNATIFWLKARSEDHLCMPKFIDFPEMIMTMPRRTLEVLQCYIFSLKVALVIHLHTQLEWFFRNAGTSKVANSALLQISSSMVALVIICVYPHGVVFQLCLMMQRRTTWFCKEMCTNFSCFFVKHCSHLAWQVLSFIFLIQSESHCARFTEPSNVGLLCL